MKVSIVDAAIDEPAQKVYELQNVVGPIIAMLPMCHTNVVIVFNQEGQMLCFVLCWQVVDYEEV